MGCHVPLGSGVIESSGSGGKGLALRLRFVTARGSTSSLRLSAQVFPVGVSTCLSDYVLTETIQGIQGLVNRNLNAKK